jgi:hypothetical protein
MLGWGWVTLGVATLSRWEGWALDALLCVFALVNLPAMLIGGLVLGLLNLPALWMRALIGSLAMWAVNYLMVRLAEWRAWSNARISLSIAADDVGDSRPH